MTNHVYVLTTADEPWGAETSLRTLGKYAQSTSSVRITVVCTTPQLVTFFEDEGIHAVLLTGDVSTRAKRFALFLRYVRNLPKTATVILFSVNLYPIIPLLRVFGFRPVVDLHDTFEGRHRIKVRTLLSFASLIISISDYAARDLGISNGKTIVVPRPIESDGSAAHARQDHEEIVAGVVGRIVPEKRVERAIEAVALTPGVKLRVFGEVFGGSQPYADTLRELARTLGVSDRVSFAGRALASYIYASIDILIVTNDMEASGRTVGEALANGVPVIVPTKGGAPEFLKNLSWDLRTLALWDPTHGAHSLHERLHHLATHPDDREALGREGRVLILEERSPSSIAGKYLDALRTVPAGVADD